MYGMKRRGENTNLEGVRAYRNRAQVLQDAEATALGRRSPAPAAPAAQASVLPQPKPKLNVQAPKTASVDADRKAKQRAQLQSQLAAAKAAGDARRAAQIQEMLDMD